MTDMTPSIEEALRSGAVRLVPVEATQDMSAAGEVALVDVLHGVYYSMPNDGMRRVLRSAIAASPDHTPALVALIEERDRLKVERDEAVGKAVSWAKYYLNRGANDLGVGEVDKLLRLVVALGNAPAVNGEQKPVAWRWRHADRITGWNAVSGSPPDKPNPDWEIQPLYAHSPSEARALAAEAERDALREALAYLGENKTRSLAFDGKTFCEDDNSDMWIVTEQQGNRNDREWVLIGSGVTPLEAILDASTDARALTQETNDGE